jgi:hypothetical protein
MQEIKKNTGKNSAAIAMMALFSFIIVGIVVIKSSANIFNSSIIEDFNMNKELICSNESTKYLVTNKTWEYVILEDKSEKEYFKKGDILVPVRVCE